MPIDGEEQLYMVKCTLCGMQAEDEENSPASRLGLEPGRHAGCSGSSRG